MTSPTLYQQYRRDEALALVRGSRRTRVLCGGQWVVASEVVLAFVDIGSPPGRSHFETGARFCWVADQPHEDAREAWPAPREVRAGRRNDRPIHLFVRSGAGSDRYTYVGTLGPSHTYGFEEGYGCGLAHFDLRPTLSSQMWRRLGGALQPSGSGTDVDVILQRLSGSQTAQERLAVLDALVDYWYGPCQPRDGISADLLRHRPLPYPLRYWYERCGRRKGILSGQNSLIEPDELESDDGRLIFYVEAEAVYLWSTAPEGDDPPVWGQFNEEEPWTREDGSLSSFLIQILLFEAIMGAPYGAAAAWVDGHTLQRLADAVPELPLGSWRWPSYPSRFYGRGGAFMFAGPNGEDQGEVGYSVWLGATTEHPLQFLRGIVDENWEYTAF